MAFLKKIFLFLLLSILTACEETFTPGMPHAAVLCVNSLVTAGEPIEVSVSKSRLYTDTSDDSGVKGRYGQYLCKWTATARLLYSQRRG